MNTLLISNIHSFKSKIEHLEKLAIANNFKLIETDKFQYELICFENFKLKVVAKIRFLAASQQFLFLPSKRSYEFLRTNDVLKGFKFVVGD